MKHTLVAKELLSVAKLLKADTYVVEREIQDTENGEILLCVMTFFPKNGGDELNLSDISALSQKCLQIRKLDSVKMQSIFGCDIELSDNWFSANITHPETKQNTLGYVCFYYLKGIYEVSMPGAIDTLIKELGYLDHR